MTDEVFISKVADIFKGLDVMACVTNSPDVIFLGSFSYMRRFQLVALAKAILELEGYELSVEGIKQ